MMNSEEHDVVAKSGVSPPGPGSISLAIFAASAVVLFGVSLTGYGLLRFNDPEAFAWAPRLLDRRLGVAGAATLVVAFTAAAGAARLALIGRVEIARALLGVAILAGAATLVVRFAEYPAIARGAGLFPRSEAPVANKATKRPSSPAASALAPADPAHGRAVYLKTCAACHAPDGSGVKAQGANLRESEFVKGKTDDQLLAFVKAGRQPFDPETKLHLSMPARGGNPALTDQDLVDAITNVREIQKLAAVEAAAPATTDGAKAAKTAVLPASGDQPQIIDGELWLPHSILPAASPGPVGSRRATVLLQGVGARGRALPNVQRFLSIVLFLGGLHAVYLSFGLALGIWASFAPRGAARQRTLVLAATYCAVIAGVGIVLLPALYL
jgi:mono/diheme cytochrome c family protein